MAGLASPLAEVNRDLELFLAQAEAAAQSAATWFTPAQAQALAAVLQRGQVRLAEGPATSRREAADSAGYAALLGQLLPVLQSLQSQLAELARRLQGQSQHLEAARSWAASQRAGI